MTQMRYISKSLRQLVLHTCTESKKIQSRIVIYTLVKDSIYPSFVADWAAVLPAARDEAGLDASFYVASPTSSSSTTTQATS